MANFSEDRQLGNFILDSLPEDEYSLIEPYLQRTVLEKNQVIMHSYQPIERVYFPTTALVSWTQSTVSGETVEVGSAGFEGMVGTPLLLNCQIAPCDVEVIIAGEGYQISAQAFVCLLKKCPTLQQKGMGFTYLKMTQIIQSSLCSRFHTTEQRLCRWLLSASDRVKTPELLLTRDNLATTIGARRPAVSIVSGILQTAGLIRTRRGKVTILDRPAMENATCECYRIVKQEFDRYLLGQKQGTRQSVEAERATHPDINVLPYGHPSVSPEVRLRQRVASPPGEEGNLPLATSH